MLMSCKWLLIGNKRKNSWKTKFIFGNVKKFFDGSYKEIWLVKLELKMHHFHENPEKNLPGYPYISWNQADLDISLGKMDEDKHIMTNGSQNAK